MRFKNYGNAKGKRARGMRGFGRFGDTTCGSGQQLASDGETCCDAGYDSVDDSGNCFSSATGNCSGCGSATCDSNGNCCPSASSVIDANGNCSTPAAAASTAAAASAASTPWYNALGSGVGAALAPIFGAKPKVSAPSSGSSLIVPAIFALGAIGVVVYVVKKK